MATSEDRQHAERLIREHKKRLRLLELRQARQGDSADPSIDGEIADIKAAISDLEGHAPSDVITEARQVVRSQYENDLEFLIADGAARNRRQTKTEETVTNTAAELHSVKSDVMVIKADLHHERVDRKRGQRRNFGLSITSLVLWFLIIGALWIILARAGLL